VRLDSWLVFEVRQSYYTSRDTHPYVCYSSSVSTNGGRRMCSRWSGSGWIRLFRAVGRTDSQPRKEGGEAQAVFLNRPRPQPTESTE